MAQHDYNIANAPGATVRADINAVLEAMASLNSGASAPSVTFPFMFWADTTNSLLKIRNAANSAWITIAALSSSFVLDTSVFPTVPVAKGGTGQTTTNAALDAFNQNTYATLASASTVAIGAATTQKVSISGTTTITAFDTVAAGTVRKLHFQGILVLTYNATSLQLPGGASITTKAGDVAEFVSLGSGNWRCTSYTRYTAPGDLDYVNGLRNGKRFLRIFVLTTSQTYTPSADATYVEVFCKGAGAGGGGVDASSNNKGASGGGEGAEAWYFGAASSQTVAIGAKGTGAAAGANDGTAGGATSFGTLCVANGGSPGLSSATGGIFTAVRGGLGGTLGACTYGFPGMPGGNGKASGSGGDDSASGGHGGGRGGGRGGARAAAGAQAGEAGSGYGAGGGGGASTANQAAAGGGDGVDGVCIIKEYA